MPRSRNHHRIFVLVCFVTTAAAFIVASPAHAWNARYSGNVPTIYPDGSSASPGYCTHGFLAVSAMNYMNSRYATADERRAWEWLGTWACNNLCGVSHYLGDCSTDEFGVCRCAGSACMANFRGASAAAAYLADRAGDADGWFDTDMCGFWPPKDASYAGCGNNGWGRPWSRMWHAINMGTGWTSAPGGNEGYSLRTAFRPWGWDGTYPRDVDYGFSMGNAAVLNACLHPVVNNYQSQSGKSCNSNDWKGFTSGGLASEGFMSVDNLGQFWFNKFARDGGTVGDLGISLHAVGDAGQPNHANGTWGNNHGVFEDWMDLNWGGSNWGGVPFDSLEDICLARAAQAQFYETSAYPGTWTDFDGNSHTGTPLRSTIGVDLASTPKNIIRKVANWAYGQTSHFDGTDVWRMQNSASIVVPTTVAGHVLMITKGVTMNAFGGKSIDNTPPCGARSSQIAGRGHLDVFTTRYTPSDSATHQDVLHKVLYEYDPGQSYNTTNGIGFGRIGWINDWLTDSGGKIVGKLGTVSWGYGRQDLFGIGIDGNMRHNWWQGSWGGWHGLGRPGGSNITHGTDAVSWGNNHLDAYVVWANSIYRIGWNGNWSAWTQIKGPGHPDSLDLDITLDGSPTVTSPEWGQTHIFVIGWENHTIKGPDNVKHILYTSPGTYYSSNTSNGGTNPATSPCGLAPAGTGRAHRYRIHVSSAPTTLTLSTDKPGTAFNTIIYVLSPFTNQILGCNDDVGGGNLKSTLSVNLTQHGEYDVYVTGSNGAAGAYELTAASSTGNVRHVYHGIGDGTNFAWRAMPYLSGMQFTQFNPLWDDPMDAVATPWSTYKVRLYALAAGNPVYEYAWDGNSWFVHNLGGVCGSNPTAVSRGHGSIDLLCLGSDGKTLYWKRNSGGGVGLGLGAWGEWSATQGNHVERVSGVFDVLSWNQNIPAVVSDASWRFSASAPNGWMSSTFNDAGWSYAVDQGEYGVGPWWTDLKWWPSLSPARWIWSYDSRGDWSAGASTLYFRKTFTATKTDYVLNISADNGFSAYLNGMLWTSSTNWVTGSTTSATASWPVTMTVGQRYTIAVQATNVSGPAGLLVDLR